mmetsp:Transcript_79585/g.234019  ORF Transcript_79585/g.234019 Transcript_79585/m.234019 type:complete len:288 (-) Transcript_79585:115-978(-)
MAQVAMAGSTARDMRWAANGTAWLTEVAPRLGVAGGVIGAILVKTTLPQVVKTSNGMVSNLSVAMMTRMCVRIIPKAGGLKMAQYGVMREMKLSLDKFCNPGVSTMLTFGVVGTVFQSVIYNTLIKDMYKIYRGESGASAAMKTSSASIAPGIVWCFGRECFSMGGGLFLGPFVKQAIQARLQERGVELPEYPTRFLAGFLSGACTALATQGMHNTSLMAGRMAALGETKGAPLYTVSSLTTAYRELGVSMFYANYPHRMLLIAGAVALLNMVDIFHRPDLIAMKAL